MDRRHFLEITGAVAAFALSGCGSGSGTTSGGPSDADWQALASSMTGALIRPGSPSYNQAYVAFNSRYDALHPQAVARCANADDVTAVLAFVRRFNLAVTPRSGGHSYGGLSTGTGVVIDVGPMNSIVLNGTTATIGAGAVLVDVYDQLIAQNVAIPTGSCASIGIAGITQGGGIGVVDRAYGLTCDNLISAVVVTADGRQLQCDATHEPDLFWAIRGGGGGNFGVATSFTFNTHPTADLTVFSAVFSLSDSAAVLAAWQEWPQDLPDTIWSQFSLWFTDDPPVNLQCGVWGVCIGSPSDLDPYWNQFLSSVGRAPISTSVGVQSYRDTMITDNCSPLTVSQCHLPGRTPDAALPRYAMAGSSDFFDTPLPPEGISALVQAIETRYASGKRGGVLLDLMGGAIGRVAADATAFVHRPAIFSAEYAAYFPVGTAPGTVSEGATWVNGMRATMAPWSSGGAYQNYIDPLIQNWQTAYYGSNYARLVQVKAQYDPTGVFQSSQGIPPR